jgi:hypothetical protein
MWVGNRFGRGVKAREESRRGIEMNRDPMAAGHPGKKNVTDTEADVEVEAGEEQTGKRKGKRVTLVINRGNSRR